MRPLLPVLAIVLLTAACGVGERPRLATGAPAPDFALPGADGRTHALRDFATSAVLAVVFTCNHCPASQLYEARIRKLHEDYRGKSVAVVAINPFRPAAVGIAALAYSDVGESLEDMKLRAVHRGLEYPYLSDGETGRVSEAFGVVATPQIFVFDRARTLRYQGRIDDNIREDLVRSREARDAIDALLADRQAPVARTRPDGCPLPTGPLARDEDLAAFEAQPVTLDMVGAEELKQLRKNGTGKLLMVNFWATWCAPCASEFPDLEATYRMYKKRNMEFVSVSVNDPAERAAVLEFLEQQHASHPNRLFATSDVYGLQAAFDPEMPSPVPFTLVLAPGGDVVYQELGAADIPKLRRAILATFPDDGKYPGLRAYWSGSRQ